MIRKLWAKFDNLDVVCTCNQNNKKCDSNECEEYIVKFIPVDIATKRSLSKSPKQLEGRKRRLSDECNIGISKPSANNLIIKGK